MQTLYGFLIRVFEYSSFPVVDHYSGGSSVSEYQTDCEADHMSVEGVTLEQ